MLWYNLGYHKNNYRSLDIEGHTLRLSKFILISFLLPVVFPNLVERKMEHIFSKHIATGGDKGLGTEKNPI